MTRSTQVTAACRPLRLQYYYKPLFFAVILLMTDVDCWQGYSGLSDRIVTDVVSEQPAMCMNGHLRVLYPSFIEQDNHSGAVRIEEGKKNESFIAFVEIAHSQSNGNRNSDEYGVSAPANANPTHDNRTNGTEWRLTTSNNDFSIQPAYENTWSLNTRCDLDRERTELYNFTVEARFLSETINRSCVLLTRMVIKLIDVNDNAPVFLDHTNLVNVYVGQGRKSKLTTVLAIDPDEGLNGQVRYHLDNYNDMFNINDRTGTLYSLKPFTHATRYDIIVRAVDRGDKVLSSTMVVRVNVTDHKWSFLRLNYIPIAITACAGLTMLMFVCVAWIAVRQRYGQCGKASKKQLHDGFIPFNGSTSNGSTEGWLSAFPNTDHECGKSNDDDDDDAQNDVVGFPTKSQWIDHHNNSLLNNKSSLTIPEILSSYDYGLQNSFDSRHFETRGHRLHDASSPDQSSSCLGRSGTGCPLPGCCSSIVAQTRRCREIIDEDPPATTTTTSATLVNAAKQRGTSAGQKGVKKGACYAVRYFGKVIGLSNGGDVRAVDGCCCGNSVDRISAARTRCPDQLPGNCNRSSTIAIEHLQCSGDGSSGSTITMMTGEQPPKQINLYQSQSVTSSWSGTDNSVIAEYKNLSASFV